MAYGDSSSTGGLGDLFSQLQAAQADLEAKAATVDAAVVEGHAAGGAVVVRLTGARSRRGVRAHRPFDSSTPADPGLSRGALLAALRDALGQVVDAQVLLAGSSRAALCG